MKIKHKKDSVIMEFTDEEFKNFKHQLEKLIDEGSYDREYFSAFYFLILKSEFPDINENIKTAIEKLEKENAYLLDRLKTAILGQEQEIA